MKKRIVAALLFATLLISLPGCAGLFKKEYLSVAEYKDDSQSVLDSDVALISNYAELKNAVIYLINDHKTEGRLRFTSYDGAIQSDISQALAEVKAENALAGFAVDYMSYDLNRIVTYYEAVVYITYKRTQSEINDIQYVTGKTDMSDLLGPVLDDMGSYIALRIASSTVSVDEVLADVNSAYYKNPLSCVVPPGVTVTIYPETGYLHIIEIEFKYAYKLSEMQKMKSALSDKIKSAVSGTSDAKQENLALDLYEKLAKACAYDPDGALRSAKEGLVPDLGSTAYGALVEGYADSRGLAAAYSALCYAAGIDCTVVNGVQGEAEHSWNIIKLDGSYYHVDVSAYYSTGITHSFMQSDKQMKTGYTWDTTAYPACTGEKSYSDIIEKVF